MKLIRLEEVCHKLGIQESEVHSIIQGDPTFPAPVEVRKRRGNTWLEHEIEGWIEKQPPALVRGADLMKFRRRLKNILVSQERANAHIGIHDYANVSEYFLERATAERPVPFADKCGMCGSARYWLRDLCSEIEEDDLIIQPPTGRDGVAKVREKKSLIQERARLKREIRNLRSQIESMQSYLALHELNAPNENGLLQHRRGLTEGEIVAAAKPLSGTCGVYFVIKNERVIYVGQSTNIYARVSSSDHWARDGDALAFILCSPDELDALESYYIHLFRPPRNGRDMRSGERMVAPMSFDDAARLVGEKGNLPRTENVCRLESAFQIACRATERHQSRDWVFLMG